MDKYKVIVYTDYEELENLLNDLKSHLDSINTDDWWIECVLEQRTGDFPVGAILIGYYVEE